MASLELAPEWEWELARASVQEEGLCPSGARLVKTLHRRLHIQ
jgi:hypothetical protein